MGAASQSEQGTTTSRDTTGLVRVRRRDCRGGGDSDSDGGGDGECESAGGGKAGATATARTTMGVMAAATATATTTIGAGTAGVGQERWGEGSRMWTAIGDDTTRLRETADSTRRATAIDDRLDGQQHSTGDTVVPPSEGSGEGGGLWVVGCGGVVGQHISLPPLP